MKTCFYCGSKDVAFPIFENLDRGRIEGFICDSSACWEKWEPKKVSFGDTYVWQNGYRSYSEIAFSSGHKY